MLSQLVPAATIALTSTFLVPGQALAKGDQTSSSAAAAAAVETARSSTQLLPISYSLPPASAAVSSVAQPVSQAEQQQPTQQQSEDPNRAAWAKWHETQRDTMRWELAYLGLSAIDAAQTIDCVHSHGCHEANPIFGRHPSAGRVILTKAALGALHFWLVDTLNKKNPREARLTAQLSAGLQGIVVVLNFSGALK